MTHGLGDPDPAAAAAGPAPPPEAAQPAVAAQPAPPRGRRARVMALARLGRGGAGRSVAQLGGGTALVMVIQVVAQMALGHWFTEDEFGVFGNLISSATIIAMVATLRLEMAVPLAKSSAEAEGIARVALATSTVLSVVLVPVALYLTQGPDPVPAAVRISVQIAPFVVWASAAFAVLRTYQSRQQQFRQMSDANVAGTAATAATQIGLASVGFTSSALGIGYGLGRVLSCVIMIVRSRLPVRGPLRWSLLRTWRQFPTWILFPAVLNAATVGAVTPLVTTFYGNGFAGQFSFSQRLLSAPVALLGQAVASVFYVRFAAMHRDAQDVSRDMTRLATVLLGIALAIFVPVALLSREVFVAVPFWAAKWETAGYISAALAPWLMVSFVSSPLSGYATVANAVRRMFALALIEAGVRVPALALGLWWGGPMAGIQAYSLAGLGICLYWTIWVMRLSGASRSTAWRVVAVPLAAIAVAWGVAQVGRDWWGQPAYVAVSLALSLSAVVVGGYGVLRALKA